MDPHDFQRSEANFVSKRLGGAVKTEADSGSAQGATQAVEAWQVRLY